MKYLVDIWNEILTWCHTTIEAPTLLTATLVPPNIDLAWVDNSDNETCFTVWRSTDGTNFTLLDTLGANVEAYTDTTATPGVTYWYRVQACTDSDTSDFSNTVETGIEFTDVEYGLLYNWPAATDARNICADGWHIPTGAETGALQVYLGANPDRSHKVREVGLTYWSANDGATNEMQFNARGSGYRDIAGFTNFKTVCSIFHYQFGGTGPRIIAITSVQFLQGQLLLNSTDGASIRPMKDSTILSHGETGIYVDPSGFIYPTICIDTQEWVACNIATKHYRNGDSIPEVTGNAAWNALGTGAWCYYNNDSANM